MTQKQALTRDDFEKVALDLGCEVDAIMAVALVESAGSGFLPSGSPKILYERHIFSRLTNKIYDKSHEALSNRNPGGYNINSWRKLEMAKLLNREAALQSCSWGKFQVMGMHWKVLGYSSIDEFVNAMYESEQQHLDSFARFIKVNNLARFLRSKDWSQFARVYNGPAYRKNAYHIKMAKAYADFKKQSSASVKISISDVQSDLKKLGYYTGIVDDIRGPKTRDAIFAFQLDNELPMTLELGDAFHAELHSRMYGDGKEFMSARKIQSLLTELGYSVGKIDGIIGKKTMNAVYRFEDDNNLYHAKGISADVVRKLLELTK